MEHFTIKDNNLFKDVRRILATKKEEFSLMEVVMTFSRTQFVERRLLGRDCSLERMEWLIVTVMKDGSDLMKDVISSSRQPSVKERMKSSSSIQSHLQLEEDLSIRKS